LHRFTTEPGVAPVPMPPLTFALQWPPLQTGVSRQSFVFIEIFRSPGLLGLIH